MPQSFVERLITASATVAAPPPTATVPRVSGSHPSWVASTARTPGGTFSAVNWPDATVVYEASTPSRRTRVPSWLDWPPSLTTPRTVAGTAFGALSK